MQDVILGLRVMFQQHLNNRYDELEGSYKLWLYSTTLNTKQDELEELLTVVFNRTLIIKD